MSAISRYAIQSLGMAMVVLALTSAAYWLTGSVALMSDALESIINVVAAGAAYFALRVSVTPPDADHPFGHHKAEYFSAVLEGSMIIVAAFAIFREAAIHFFEPKALDAPGLGIAINAVSSAINAVWGWHLIRIGRREKSPALGADGRHVLADAVSSWGVIIGVIAAVLSGWLQLDALIAAGVGVYILVSGWRLLKESVGGLMDQAADPATLAAIQASIAKAAQGAIEAHDLQTRHAGPVTFIQFHLVVPAAMTVTEAHDICDRIENTLREAVPGARVAIHVEPEDKA
ncbi:MAG: cation transporter, partial [Rhodomicrobium sp.]|nr:cation transporter [Rhodomicrobium sp.]